MLCARSGPTSVTLPRPMRVLILGGDGYLGWPTAMRFSARGHEVSVVDDFSRRRWHDEAGTGSLTPIADFEQRIAAWKELSGEEIRSFVGSVQDGDFLDGVVAETRPEAVVHYGQQASAPYSMALAREGGRDPARQRDRHPQPALRDPRPRARLPPGQARHDGRVRPARDRYRGGLHRDRAQGPHATPCPSPSCRPRSITAPRFTTRPTSTSPAAPGACAPPTSTRASSTGSRPRRAAATSASSPASTTTRSSARCSTASVCRP